MTGRGTRFRIYPQAEGWAEPETIELSPPPGSIGAGPADGVMVARLPEDKAQPYDPPVYVPPYAGPCLPAARPDAAGHFDHIATDDPAFLPAHMYACVRHTLDAWQRHLGRPIVWWDAEVYPRMELIALVDWANAQSGPGFIEAGGKRNGDGGMRLFCLNFDIMAHETGHAILFSTMGAPARPSAAFLAFHESFSDLVSMVAALDFPSVIDRLLLQTGGNLYVLNMLNRVGEMSGTEQIRVADNTVVMDDVAGLRLGADGAWIDPTGQDRNAHALAQPLTGAMFDILVELFQDGLIRQGALPPDVDPRHWSRDDIAQGLARLRSATHRAYAAFGPAFHVALREAREGLAAGMARVMRELRPDDLTFDRVAGLVIEACAAAGYRHLVPELIEIMLRRGIDPRPTLRRRTEVPAWGRLPYAERARRVAASRRGIACDCDPAGALLAHRLIRTGHLQSRVMTGSRPHRMIVSVPEPR